MSTYEVENGPVSATEFVDFRSFVQKTGTERTSAMKKCSDYPMISVEDALVHVLRESDALEASTLPLSQCYGNRAWEEVRVQTPFPAFPVSIMDGYALCAPLKTGVYPVQQRVRAGDGEDVVLSSGEVVYITTGARMPAGADAVVKVEETSAVAVGDTTTEVRSKGMRGSDDTETHVRIDVDVPQSGINVRQVGSDMAVGELLVGSGQLLGPTEIGLLATAGVHTVQCFGKPKVGVLSTGNELVDISSPAPLQGSQIRDSNRAALLAAFRQDGYDVMDFGIVGDTHDALRAVLLQACRDCDVVVTSGGVSMGDADLVKPMLAELGSVHFGRLNMKPGKPTTFATINDVREGGGKNFIFGLPGNPVSCLVTKALFVDPCLRRLQGESSEGSLHTQLPAKLVGGSLKLDPERAEYHRGVVSLDPISGAATVRSTGNQRSSRLLSMGASNALICLAQGPGTIQEGDMVTVILTSASLQAVLPPPCDGRVNVHQKAATFDDTDTSSGQKDNENGMGMELTSLQSLGVITSALPSAPIPAPASVSKVNVGVEKIHMRVGLLTISDRASAGTYKDESGPEMAKLLELMEWPLLPHIMQSAIVPDEPKLIRQKIMEWIDSGSIDLLLSSGGTGFGLRDCTPEAVRPMLHREAPGIAQALLNEGLKHTPLAVLSRPVAGTRGSCFVATLPGSVKAVRENILALQPLLPRIMELLISNTCSGHSSTGVAQGNASMCDCCK